MNILHLTDFHYSQKGKEPSKIINAIIGKLQEEKILIDFVFFTGDLVNIGGEDAPYWTAKELLFDPLVQQLGIASDSIIICSGNHDIDRTKVSKALKSHIDGEIINNDKLNEFYKNNNGVDFKHSIASLNPFFSFSKKFYDNVETNILESPLYSIHFRNHNSKNIGIACINTPWLSAVFDDDKGNLFVPTDLLINVCKRIKHCDQKIILMHHPLYFLRDFNAHEVENIVHSEFDLHFSGHVHKLSSLTRHNGTNGIFEHVAKASLTSNEKQGCSIVSVDDVEDNRISVREVVFVDEIGSCAISEVVNHTIPCGNEKAEILSFRKKLHDKVGIEKENANNLLLLDNDDGNNDFLTLFSYPVLKKESESDLESKNTPIIGFEEFVLMEDNFFVLGKDKCGKTSLLRRLQIEHLNNFSRNGRIPFYIDAKVYELSIDNKFSFEDLIRNYYETNRAKAKEILSSPNFVLLVDNYVPNSGFATYLEQFLNDHPSIKFVVCAEENLSRTVDMKPFGNAFFEKIFFHKLRKQELVVYTEKRLGNNSKKEEIRDRIVSLCKQLELPMNYWTISLLLLIHNKSSESYSKNLFSILDACVDEIFNKKKILLSRHKISYDQLKKICAELAKAMFINHPSTIYGLSENEALHYIEDIISENERISMSREEIFTYLCGCGVLKQRPNDQKFVFRLNGFFEYFLAYQMTKDSSFKDDIIHDDAMFVAFKNQIEIFSGLRRDDFDFLDTIFQKVKAKINPVFEEYDDNKDSELLQKVETKAKVEQFCKQLSIKKTLTAIEKAKFEDQFEEPQIDSEVHIVKAIDVDNITSELLEKYISILARTFRSSDEISGRKNEKQAMFNYIIDSYCNFGYYIVDEFEKFARKEIELDSEFDVQNFPELELMNYISNFTPLICQVFLFDGIGHFSLERVIKSEIDSIIQKSPITEYKLFMLCFLLLDIDLEGNKDYIETIMRYIKMPVLKYAIVIKLSYYLAFKGGDNKEFQRKLSNYIQQARLNLDNSSSISDIHRQIQAKKKESLIAKHME
jgi:predicted MPP superfamily phosphohydrolase